MAEPYNVLFLCTRNSARSIMAESILNHLGEGRFRAFSAGSQPGDEVNPLAVETLRSFECPVGDVRSKSWDEFATANAPEMDFVFTVCDNAAGETCPAWPGQPISAQWPIEDPAAVEGAHLEKLKAFNLAFRYLWNRIELFVALPIVSLDRISLRARLDQIGDEEGTSRPMVNPALSE
ncbi:ArsR family transcriptional regulator [Notoacmeibacter marinus]|uniref:ArsR family transcriptional regulator n=1 Tax=Notoacmeibacter marinus TaxID=1876515 RepID=A0A231V2Y7_9HYPH|nr:arsenate reductase ArsC [Notoacmeibacter marinus]OXT02391.1 ArsR family transcriptional regulator [Notoacmeibacter marinus]